MINIRSVTPKESNVAMLIKTHLAGMTANSHKDSVYALNASGLAEPDVTMFGAFENEICLSIGAVKRLNASEGEIKSMRTKETALGRGFGKSILKHIIAFAKEQGWSTLRLETGTGPTFSAAHHVYISHGFSPCGPFGDYEQSNFNRFFKLDL